MHSISFEAMEYLFSRCPNLATLCVECGAVLENLPQYCPNLTSLTFVYLRNDDAVPFIELLKKFEQKDTLKTLRLSSCRFQDEAVLVAIANLLPRLECLSLSDSSFSKESAIALINSGMLRVDELLWDNNIKLYSKLPKNHLL